MTAPRYAIYHKDGQVTDFAPTRGACYYAAFGMGLIEKVDGGPNRLKERFSIFEGGDTLDVVGVGFNRIGKH